MVGGRQEITHANVASWGECGYECWGRAECRAWTWTSATRRCVTLAGNPELAVQSGAYSGGHHCSAARLGVVGGKVKSHIATEPAPILSLSLDCWPGSRMWTNKKKL